MRIAIADDSGVFRDSLARSLREIGHTVVVEAGDGTELLGALQTEAVDVVVVDVDMPPSGRAEGVNVAHQLKLRSPELPILLISAYTATPHAIELLQTFDSGIGYLHKNHIANIVDLAQALLRLQDGEPVIDAELVERLLTAPDREPDLASLTTSERLVLRLMAEGYSNSGIAKLTGVTERTVEDHAGKVFAKLDLNGPDLDGGPVSGRDGNKRVLAVLAYLRLARP
jgi:DNA-binding NarL/FixJ family response regulator